ncbi:SEC-C metal-binding domain-containing protein [Bacillus massiliglaciei]|uniref:SEC-C metal-binding domain-containing protein n=1 Tax=Bacillus massiliglaciei TaxID=1816693 RepID=UPI000DA60250|nr:SEC-C metal-binding domain-containing protein [Bacillus massiliglaciei]
MREIDAFEILDGKAIKYLDAFGTQDGIALKSKYEGKTYWIYDYYCMHPNCKCNEVYLEFVEEKQNKDAAVQHFGVRIPFGDGNYVIEDYNLAKAKATEIVEETLKYSEGVFDLFKQRYNQMKEKGQQIIIDHANAQRQPYVNTEVTGRNEPCPCGSGKKFKKCCGKAS